MKNRSAVKQLLSDLNTGAFPDDLFEALDTCQTDNDVRNVLNHVIQDANKQHMSSIQSGDMLLAGVVMSDITIVENIKNWITVAP